MTPIQELIYWIETNDAKNNHYPSLFDIEQKTNDLLKKEKQMIIDAYESGVYASTDKEFDANEYYKETFDQ